MTNRNRANARDHHQVEKGPMWQLLFWISLAEILLFPTVIDMDKKDREPGDFALDPLNLCKVKRNDGFIRSQQ